jgi:hypothetical protein
MTIEVPGNRMDFACEFLKLKIIKKVRFTRGFKPHVSSHNEENRPSSSKRILAFILIGFMVIIAAVFVGNYWYWLLVNPPPLSTMAYQSDTTCQNNLCFVTPRGSDGSGGGQFNK